MPAGAACETVPTDDEEPAMPTNCKPATPVGLSAAQRPICCWVPYETFGASSVLLQPTAASAIKPRTLAVHTRQRSSVLIRRIRIE
jgi:hypothetical protein